MAAFPERIRLAYKESKRAGLFAAVSDDLPGLMTVAPTIEEVDRRVTGAIAQLVKAQYGVDIVVTLHDADEDADDFKPLGERTMELHAA